MHSDTTDYWIVSVFTGVERYNLRPAPESFARDEYKKIIWDVERAAASGTPADSKADWGLLRRGNGSPFPVIVRLELSDGGDAVVRTTAITGVACVPLKSITRYRPAAAAAPGMTVETYDQYLALRPGTRVRNPETGVALTKKAVGDEWDSGDPSYSPTTRKLAGTARIVEEIARTTITT